MSELITLARPYAKAAFRYAFEHKQLTDWSYALKELSVVSEKNEIQTLLKQPELTCIAKADVLINICKESLNKPLINFLYIIAQNRRLELISKIFKLFEKLKVEQQKLVEVEVTSAFALEQEQLDKLERALSERLDRKVRLSALEDKKLIGGAIIRTGDLVIDGSIQGKLKKLSDLIKS